MVKLCNNELFEKGSFMKGNVFDYFEDLSKHNLKERNGVIKVDGVKLRRFVGEFPVIINLVSKDKDFFEKRWGDAHSVQEIVASKMYNDLGIVTPPVSVVLTEDQKFLEKLKNRFNPNIATMSQDIKSIDGFFVDLAQHFHKVRSDRFETYPNYKWEVLYNSDLKKLFLSFMTPECLEELVNVFLLDELRTDVDRHTANYFLVKGFNSDRYEYVVPFEFEHVELLLKGDISGKDNFSGFLGTPYESTLPHSKRHDNLSYKRRIEEIIELVNDGVLSQNSINLIKSALGYDFPKLIKETNDKYKAKNGKKHYEAVSRLWEYNNEKLGKEL